MSEMLATSRSSRSSGLSPGRRVCVLWWLHPDAGPPGDGRHVGYLKCPDIWRDLDRDLFDALRRIVNVDARRVAAIETSDVLPCATWFSEEVPTARPWRDRASRRLQWFGRARDACGDADIVFVDPDNGLGPRRFDPGRQVAAKSVSMAELHALEAPGRTLVVYHHQTRRKGGHSAEIASLASSLRAEGFSSVDAIRAKPGSARAFFILNAGREIQSLAADLCARWTPYLAWHPDAG